MEPIGSIPNSQELSTSGRLFKNLLSPPFWGWSWTEFTITEATTGLLYQPRMVMSVERSVEWVVGETEVSGENLPQCRFVHQRSPMTWLGLEPRKPAINHLSYGTALKIPLPGLELRPGRAARSQSLYRPRYCGSRELVSGPSFEPGVCGIRNRSVASLTATFSRAVGLSDIGLRCHRLTIIQLTILLV
jgi:hypothetical protein